MADWDADDSAATLAIVGGILSFFDGAAPTPAAPVRAPEPKIFGMAAGTAMLLAVGGVALFLYMKR